MARKSEREFIQGDDVSDDVFAALNGEGGEPQDEAPIDAGAPQDAVVADPAPDVAVAPPIAPQADPEPKMVDIRALQEARSEIRKRDEEIARTRTEQARLDERLKLLNEALQPKPAEKKIPTVEDEPIEHFMHEIGTLKEQLAAREKADAERAEQMRMVEERQSTINQADVVLSRAVTAEPELAEAFTFAFSAVRNNVADWVDQNYPNATDAQKVAVFEQTFENERLKYARLCPRDPVKAAEFVRANARYHGWGYQPQGQQAPAAAQAPAAPQAAPPIQQPTIQQRQEQQQRHMSLSGIPGSEPPKKLDAKAILALSEKEFAALRATVEGRKALEEEFGGY